MEAEAAENAEARQNEADKESDKKDAEDRAFADANDGVAKDK